MGSVLTRWMGVSDVINNGKKEEEYSLNMGSFRAKRLFDFIHLDITLVLDPITHNKTISIIMLGRIKN